MRGEKFNRFICWGVTAFFVIAASIAFAYILLKLNTIKEAISLVLEIMAPVIYGAVMAYLLTPIYNRCVAWMAPRFSAWIKNEKKGMSLAKALATVVSTIVLIVIVAGLFSMLIPELLASAENAINALPQNISNFSIWLTQVLSGNSEASTIAIDALNRLYEWAQGVLELNMDKILTFLGGLSSGVIGVLVWMKNILIGVIVMIYLLNIKDQFVSLAKKIVYGIFSLKWANRIVREARYIHKVFGGFIIGKIVDSIIIGILCFLGLSVMNMPYTLLVSVIVGVTNVIPFFGPFIGAIPSALLILLVSPIQCLYFLIFILVLQQFDGNILGPKILGDTTGISSFWVLFSILLFGGLLGFVGMIVGVPIFAVFYRLLGDFINGLLEKKDLPVQTSQYDNLETVEEKDKSFRRLKSKQTQ